VSQLDLYTRDDPRWVAVREEAKIAIAVVTLKDFAFRCDASPSSIADGIAERDQKRMAARHLVTLIDIAPRDNALALARQVVGPRFRVEHAVVYTPEEEARITRDYVARVAPGLLPGLMKELGR
jgi:hypothetical protein